jgi:hypothetical protein
MQFHNPAPGRRITSPYGMRKHPIHGTWRKHHGIDFGGTFNVKCTADGIVEHIGWNPTGGGHVVRVKHGNMYSVYYHGAERTKFKKGDRIMAGEVVYKSGSTGASTGPHLHFELRRSKIWGTTVDPHPYLFGGQNPSSPPLKITGRLDRETWRKWQTVLKDDWGYIGIVDGIPGKLTWSAVQRSGVPYGYSARAIDGIPGPNTRKAVQRRLAKSKYYTGRIDGIWGRGTISALQRALNDGKY